MTKYGIFFDYKSDKLPIEHVMDFTMYAPRIFFLPISLSETTALTIDPS
jgi:hypothetical protein